MRIRGGLVGLLFFLLAGCSFILDPEECQGDGDCANGQSCSSGICLGPVIPLTPEDAGGDVLNADMAAPDQGLPPDEGVDPDRGLPPDAADADVPPARPPICEILEPVGPEVGPLSADRITVRGVVGDPDTAVADRQATFAGAPVALDGDGMFEVEVELAEGRNVLELTAIDDTMLSCRAQVVVRSDRTAPVLVIEEPNGDVPVNGSFNPFRVSGTVEDTGGISAIEVTLNDAPVDGPAPAVGAFGFPVALVPGANAIEVTAVDQAGNRSAPVRRVITLDEEPPVVTIESPEDGTRTPESMIRVAGQVTTDGVGEFRSRLALRVNGRAVPLAGNAGISDEEGRFDLTVALEVGDNRIEVDGNDRADNHGVGAVTVVREDPAPCVAIEAPADDAFVGTPDVEITGTVCPAVTAVELRVGNGAAVAGVVADGRFTGTATLPAGRASTVTVRALTDDNQSAEDSVRLFHDDTPPTVRINVPAIGACLNTATIRVCGQADDPESGIASVTVNAVAGAFLNGDYCAELPLPDGANQPLRVVAENGAGLRTRLPALGQPEHLVNVDREPVEIIVQNGDDVPWLRPDGAGDIVLRGSFNGGICAALNARIERLCEGEEPVDPACVANPQEVGIQGNGAFNFRRRFPDGRQRGVLIRATDTAGNISERRYAFRVDSQAPEIVDLPAGGFTTEPTFEVCAVVRDPASGVTRLLIGGVEVAVVPVAGDDRRGCRDVPLVEGENPVAIEVTDLVGNRTTGEVRITRDTSPPDVAITWPAEGDGVPSPALAEGTIDDGPTGSGARSVRVNGVPAIVDAEAGVWRAGRIPIDPDDPVLVVEADDRSGNAIAPIRLAVTLPPYVDLGAARSGLVGALGVGWLGITDADADGLQDVIALTDQPDGVSAVYSQRADGTFGGLPGDLAGLPDGVAIRAAALGDVDGDGMVDLVLSAPASTGAYLGQGDGSFLLTNSGIPVNVLADGLSLGDLNRDGTLDVLLLAGAATRVQTNVAGRFNTQPLGDFALQAVVDAQRALFADVNGDQVLDLITIGAAGSRLLLGSLAGPFRLAAGFDAFPAERVAVMDANRDGRMDVFTGGAAAARFQLAGVDAFSNDLLGLEWLPGDVGLTMGDLDGDTRDDVVVYGAGGLRAYRGVAAGFEPHDFGLPAVGVAVRALAIADLNGDGDLDLVYAGLAGVGVISSNLRVLEPDRRYSRVDIRRGTEGEAGPADAVGAVVAHEYAPGQLRLIPALPGAPTHVTLSGDDIEVQVRFIDLGDQGGASRSLPALVAEPGVIYGPE